MTADPSAIVHLALSHKAARIVDQMLDYGSHPMDGCAADYVDDVDGDMHSVITAIREDIKEQLPSKRKSRRKK